MDFAHRRTVNASPSAQGAQPLVPIADAGLKAAVDLVLAALGLFALAPLFIVIAIAIRIDSPGGVFFRQKRTGLNNEPFRIYKFRTMRPHECADGTVAQATRDDARITRIGRFLRRTSLDELPQLLNVLRGEMSLVGPRPHALEHDRLYSREIPNYVYRFGVRPGLTGLAQISGSRGETPTVADMERRISLDLQYIQSRTLALDLKIIVMTLYLEIRRKSNAY